MNMKIALAGNPNTGKTTLFNALTGTNQYVGNWPGVTVEKKEGGLKGHKDVTVVDLPGIYSLSPYTLEEVVARNYLIQERPDAILNIIDGTNLERNLYLTTQLMELGLPVVVAVNMMDVVRRSGDKLDTKKLSDILGCPVVEISALKGDGVKAAAEAAVKAAGGTGSMPLHRFSGTVEHALAHIEELVLHKLPEEQQRWYAIKLFERDDKVTEQLGLEKALVDHIEQDIRSCEEELDDDARASSPPNAITGSAPLSTAAIPAGTRENSLLPIKSTRSLPTVSLLCPSLWWLWAWCMPSPWAAGPSPLVPEPPTGPTTYSSEKLSPVGLTPFWGRCMWRRAAGSML